MKKWLLVLALTPLVVFAQDKKYFQQQVDYKISAELNELEHSLTCKEKIVYTNNSPDDLDFIYFHLWPNAYANNKTSFAKQQIRLKKDNFYFSHEDNYGWLEYFHFLNGKDTLEYMFEELDVVKVKLPKPLKPSDKITLKVPFKVKLPHTFSRLGHVKNSYQISQWYPKPAVYDKDGWHQMPYLDEGEFYSEFGSFDVSITLPSNYKLAATGELQSKLEKKFINAHANNPESLYEYSMNTKTVRYVQDNVHDFAWFADADYKIAHDSVQLESGKIVQVWYYYTDYWKKSVPEAIRDLKDAVYCYSKWVGEYPYSSATAVTGALGAGGGMEYPMVTVTDPFAIIHEVGHNWFYGILGSNERDYGWMDEGYNSFVENKVYEYQWKREDLLVKDSIAKGLKSKPLNVDVSPKQRQLVLSSTQQNLTHSALWSRNFAQPVQLHSNKYYEFNYGVSLYSNPPLYLDYLKEYLGEDLFWKCMKEYYSTWKFKHPQPRDLKASFEKSSGKDLSWFFEGLVKTVQNVDVKIKSVSDDETIKLNNDEEGTGSIATLKNLGKIQIPVYVSVYNKEDKRIDSFWVDGFEDEKNVVLKQKDAHYVKLNETPYNLDLVRNNDFSRVKGLKKLKVPKLRFLNGMDYPDKCEIYFFPFVGYNYYDGMMPSLAFYNTSLVSKKFEFLVAPAVSLKMSNGGFKGQAAFNYKWNGKTDLTRSNLMFSAMRYADWNKFQLTYNNNSFINLFGKRFKSDFEFSNYFAPNDFGVTYWERYGSKISYNLKKSNAISKIKLKPTVEYIANKLYSMLPNVKYAPDGAFRYNLEASYARQFIQGKWVELRMFAGAQSYAGTYFDYGISGKNDYFFEYYTINRLNYVNTPQSYVGIGTRQTNDGDGGFRQLVGGSARSILAFNFKSDIPKVPFKLFADYAMINNGVTYYDAGLSLKLVDDFIGVHFPIVGSGYANGSPSSFRNFTDNIRFTLKWKVQPIEQVLRNQFLY